MKYRSLLTLFFAGILANVSGAQSSGKSVSLSMSYAEPLESMQWRNNQSFGGFLMYTSSFDETFRFTLETGAYVWSIKNTTAKESTQYTLSVPIVAGVDVLLSDNYLVPFFGVRAGIQFYSGDVIKLVNNQYGQRFDDVEEIRNKAGFLVHPEIGWRFPFSDIVLLDVRGGYTRGTGKQTAFSYATFNLGLVFAFPSSL